MRKDNLREEDTENPDLPDDDPDNADDQDQECHNKKKRNRNEEADVVTVEFGDVVKPYKTSMHDTRWGTPSENSLEH